MSDKPWKVMLVGGGTGGHITPNLAVAAQLKAMDPTCQIVYVLEKKAKFGHMLKGQPNIDNIAMVSAGKFRRYHGESWLRRLFDVQTNLLNLRDFFRMLAGLWQAWRLLRRERPDVIFIKGGFVGVPIGFAASRLHIPFVTHDSDTLPGLANRLVGRWATYHATGMPAEFYSYPPAKTHFVGNPLQSFYGLVSAEQERTFKKELGLNPDGKVLFIAGGSNGAEKVNQAIRQVLEPLLQTYPQLTIIHQLGKGQLKTYADLEPTDRLIAQEYFTPEEMARNSGAADVIVARAGASTIGEFAAQAKACIVIPNPLLTGGHQVKNAQHLAKQGAIEVYNEADLAQPDSLRAAIANLLDHPEIAQELAHHLGALARPHAAADIAQLLAKASGRNV